MTARVTAMPDPSAVYDWLDLWEQHLSSGGSGDLDAFVHDLCGSAAPELVATFRRRAEALRRVRCLFNPAGTDSTRPPGSGDTDEPAEGRLTRGAEPIPGYRLDHRLGRGGFGEVWAVTARDGKKAALKYVRLGAALERGERRAVELLADVEHPHLIRYLDTTTLGNDLVVVMELADRTLADRLREAQLPGQPGVPRDELLGYMAAAAAALDYLHAGGDDRNPIIHRDIKPQNLLLAGSVLKVADFGLARCLEHTVSTHTGGRTTAYAAPEIFKSRVTAGSDQYSLAVTYCQLRGGRLPFVGSEEQVTHGHLDGEPDLTMLPPDERPVVRRALAKTPRHRWPSCAAFVAALRDGADPVAIRNELIRDQENFTVRRLYLAVRTPAQEDADRALQLSAPLWRHVWGMSLPLRFLGAVAAGGYLAIWGVEEVAQRLRPGEEVGGWWKWAGMALPLLLSLVFIPEMLESLRERRRIRAALARLGPFRRVPPGATAADLDERLLGPDRVLGPDRDVSGPAGATTAPSP